MIRREGEGHNAPLYFNRQSHAACTFCHSIRPKNGVGASLDDFIEVIPVSKLEHVGRFDIDAYKNFHKNVADNSIHYQTIDWMEQPVALIDKAQSTEVNETNPKSSL